MTKSNPKKILLIDDDPGIIALLTKWLNVANREVIISNTGQEGLQKAKTLQPDLILLDIMLPDIGGVELTQMIQRDPQINEIPIIFITACMGVETDKGDEEIEIKGKTYRVFAKPLHNAKLLSEIRKAINRRENNNI